MNGAKISSFFPPEGCKPYRDFISPFKSHSQSGTITLAPISSLSQTLTIHRQTNIILVLQPTLHSNFTAPHLVNQSPTASVQPLIAPKSVIHASFTAGQSTSQLATTLGRQKITSNQTSRANRSSTIPPSQDDETFW